MRISEKDEEQCAHHILRVKSEEPVQNMAFKAGEAAASDEEDEEDDDEGSQRRVKIEFECAWKQVMPGEDCAVS